MAHGMLVCGGVGQVAGRLCWCGCCWLDRVTAVVICFVFVTVGDIVVSLYP
jgi:hypothetical protein